MKFVTLVISTIIFSATASAQTTQSAKKSTAHSQQKIKLHKPKSSPATRALAKKDETITLTDEKSYRAKWSFEEMLLRAVEVDAARGAAKQQTE